MLPTIYKVFEKRWENSQTFTLVLEIHKKGRPLEAPMPGQFNMLYAFGIGEVPISLSGIRTDKRLEHTIRIVGDVTRALSKLEVGSSVGVRGPFGGPWPVESGYGKNLVILAGGVALAPVRPVIQILIKKRELFKNVTLILGARNPSELLFQKEYKEWEDAGLHIKQTVDFAFGSWQHDVGYIPALIPQIRTDLKECLAFVCGPEIMMKITSQELIRFGMDKDDIFLSMERNMKCAIGLCGHCQWGSHFICRDGPVYSYSKIQTHLQVREL